MKTESLIKRYYDAYYSVYKSYGCWAKLRGITVNEGELLKFVFEHESITQNDICEALQMSKQTVNNILNKFSDKGLICKKENEKDRRSKIIALTDSGSRYAGYVVNDLTEIEKNSLLKMSEEDRENFIKTQEIFAENMRNELKKITAENKGEDI